MGVATGPARLVRSWSTCAHAVWRLSAQYAAAHGQDPSPPRPPHRLVSRPVNRPEGERAADGRTAERVVLGLYLLVLAWVVLLKLHTGDFGDLSGRRSLNLVPFARTGDLGGLGSSELAVNVLAFVPLGVLLHLAARRRSLGRLLVPVVGVALAFEVIQLVFGIGTSDVTDLLTNTAGGLIGLGLAWLGFRVLGTRAQRWVLVGTVVVLLALAAAFVTWLQVAGVRFRL